MKMLALRHVVLPVVSILMLTATMFSMAQAQNVQAESGQAFSISPPLIELKADPGKTVVAKIKLTNISSGELLMKTQLNDFGAKNESGEPNIIFDESDASLSSLHNWIASPTPFKLASKETKTLEFPITVPMDAEPGGHYAVIRFTGNSPELEESGVALSASVGSLVLLQVSGDVQEKASMKEFYSATPRFEKSGFFENGPISFVERINNEGNVHIKPTGTVEIINMFGQKTASLRVNGDPSDSKNTPKSVLPESIRRFEQTLDNYWMFGKYDAKLTLSYGQGKTLSATSTFWVIPYKLIILTIVALVGLFFLARFGLRKYNDHIIEKSQRRL